MSNILLKNLPLKIFSIIVGSIIWLVVMNIANPYTEVKFNIPITLEVSDYLKDKNVEYSIDKSYDNLNISFMVRNNNLKFISQSYIEPYVSLENTPDDNLMPVLFKFKNNIDSYMSGITYNPRSVHIVSEDIKTEKFDLEYEFIGNKPNNIYINDVYLNPKTIYVRGLKNNVNKLAKVGVSLPYNNKPVDYSGSVEPILYDAEGNVIDSQLYELNVNSINYSISVLENKVVPITVNIVGEPPAGCEYNGYVVEPQNITISGPNSRVGSITSIDLPVIDISQMSENETVIFPISNILQPPIVTPHTGDITVVIAIENNTPTAYERDDGYQPLENEPTPEIRRGPDTNHNEIVKEELHEEPTHPAETEKTTE